MPAPLFISEADCRRVLRAADVIGAIEDTLLADAEGGVRWSEPRNMKMADRLSNHYHLKACVLEAAAVAGVRLVAHQSDESTGSATRWIVLIDPSTALPLAIVDETWNYAQRTVAVMAVVARKLAASTGAAGYTLGLVGAGRLAAAALTYYRHLFDLKEVRIASRREPTRTALAEQARTGLGLNAAPAASVREAVEGADLILTCTSSGQSLLSADWVGPGAVVASLETAEPGPDLFRAADLVVVDSREQLKAELESCYGQDAPGRVAATFSEVLAGKHAGRTSPGQRVLIISQGLASLDVAVAFRAYQRYQGSGRVGL
jgi:alanine dehydrogenase